jgi:hypothetical protein
MKDPVPVHRVVMAIHDMAQYWGLNVINILNFLSGIICI